MMALLHAWILLAGLTVSIAQLQTSPDAFHWIDIRNLTDPIGKEPVRNTAYAVPIPQEVPTTPRPPAVINDLGVKVREAFKIAVSKQMGISIKVSPKPNFQELFPLPRREEYIQEKTKLFQISLDALTHLSKITSHDADHLLKTPAVKNALEREFSKCCLEQVSQLTCDPKEPFRKIDGSCNNLEHPWWGMAETPQERFLPDDYDDGINSPRSKGRDGLPLPSPREISNIVHIEGARVQTNDKPYRLSVMVMQWGQFLTHDIVGTPVMRDPTGSSFDCCGKDKSSPACIPIDIPANDPFFKKRCMNAVRSAPTVGPDCSVNSRRQINKVTSFLDASAVYGSSTEVANRLRKRVKGLLRVGEHNLLPPNDKNVCIKLLKQDSCQLTGDERPNVTPGVGALHTLFVREHNRIAEKLSAINPQWNDERIYQETRKIVSALIQHITYKEYLPVILGQDYMNRYILVDTEFGHHYVYNEQTNPGITSAFAGAAFRFGHSTVPNKQTYIGPQFEKRRGIEIERTLHRPFYLQRSRDLGYEGILRWLMTDAQPEVDRSFEKSVRDKLFLHLNVSLDIAALNIQRGRDHGIPSYNKWRQWCGLPVAYTFAVVKNGLIDHDPETAALLGRAYRHPDDIDLFTGGISEMHNQDGVVGPTFACILGTQFKALKTGDRFWYETTDPAPGFTTGQLDSIKTMRFSKIICENMNIPDIQRNVFHTWKIGRRLRRHIPCDLLPDLNFYAWMEKEQKWVDKFPEFKTKSRNTRI